MSVYRKRLTPLEDSSMSAYYLPLTPIDNGQPCVTPTSQPGYATAPNPFSVDAIRSCWCSNDLIMQDIQLRRLARVRPLDCGIRDLYLVNPIPKM